MDQLCNIYYSTVKLRLPDDKLINELLDNITTQLCNKEVSQNLSMKNLALLTWASARIKVPKSSPLSNLLLKKSIHSINLCTENSFLFNWMPEKSSSELPNPL